MRILSLCAILALPLGLWANPPILTTPPQNPTTINEQPLVIPRAPLVIDRPPITIQPPPITIQEGQAAIQVPAAVISQGTPQAIQSTQRLAAPIPCQNGQCQQSIQLVQSQRSVRTESGAIIFRGSNGRLYHRTATGLTYQVVEQQPAIQYVAPAPIVVAPAPVVYPSFSFFGGVRVFRAGIRIR